PRRQGAPHRPSRRGEARRHGHAGAAPEPAAYRHPRAVVRQLVRDLSLALRERVLPMLGSHAGRAHAGELSAGGDVTFRIDEEAEELLETWLAERAPEVAFYSEDRGLVLPSGGSASDVLVV